jgi:hypothetical protein
MWSKLRLEEGIIKGGIKGCKEWNVLNRKKQEGRIKCRCFTKEPKVQRQVFN